MPEPDLLQYFQDREDAIASFDALWVERQSRWILAFGGFSGIGKSTLIEWLVTNRCQTHNIPYSVVDFATPREYKDLLGGIFRHSGLRVHIPDSIYQEYETKRDRILASRAQTTSIVIEQQQIEGEGNNQLIKLNLTESYNKLDLQARDLLTDAWLDCVRGINCERLVIFFDTFENYQETAPRSAVDWLWMVFEEAHKILPGLRLVVGSRQPVTANTRIVQRQELRLLDANFSEMLLLKLDVTDSEYRNAVFQRLANGHPLVTTFAAYAWLEGQKSGNPVTAQEIPRVGRLEEAIRWIQDAVISRLQDPFKSAVRWASLLRSFNLWTNEKELA